MHNCTLSERTDWIDFQAATEGTGEEEAGEMGRKLDLSGLSEEEAQHVLKVVQRDMKLREKEETRLSEMKQELDEEGSRSTLLSRQPRFNERCCIRCCAPFTFLFHPKRTCPDCQFNVCKDCCAFSRKDKAWLCTACQKTRLLKTQSLEWYYNNVRRRFKRFGSAKVLKTLYRKHAAEQGNLAELTEESTYAGSTCNEGSVCESDSAFHKQIEEHNMADTITVALRVAEEAIEEAITKAEAYTDNQEKQKEAQYLRDNRDELIEELATTIVHKIIRRRRDLSELQPDYSMEWPLESDSELLTTTTPLAQSSLINAASLKSSLWRSRSAFALHSDGNPEPESKDDNPAQPPLQTLKKEGTPIQPSWKSVDRLDNSMLQSQDGNWIALQSSQLSRPSLLTKRKSLVFSVLEKESGVVSAYDEMGSDTEPEPDGAWGAALLEFRRKMNIKENTGGDREEDDDDDDGYGDPKDDDDDDNSNKSGSDTDLADFGLEGVSKMGLDGARLRYNRPLLSKLKKEPAAPETLRPTTSRRTSIIDLNFNPGVGDSSEAEETPSATPTRTRKRRRSRREHHDDTNQQSPFATALSEYSTLPVDDLVRMRNMKQEAFNQMDAITSDTATPDVLSSGFTTPEPFRSDPKDTLYTAHKKTSKPMNQVLATRLQELASKVPDVSSTEDELDRRSSKLHRKSCSEEMEAHETMWDMEVDDADSGRAAGRAFRHAGRRGDSRLSSMDAGSMEETRDDDAGDAHMRAVRAKALELDTQMKIGEKVEMEIKSRQMSISSVEQTWWETLGSLGSDGSKGDRSYEPLSELEHSATYDGLDAGSGIDDILTDMVRSSEKSAEDWDIAEDLVEAMDVGEDKAEDTWRATDEVQKKNTRKHARDAFPTTAAGTDSWNVAMIGKQKGREGTEEDKTGVEEERSVECQTESYTQGGQRAQMGKVKKTAERGTAHPTAELREEKSKREEASTKSHTEMRGQEKAEGDSKMYGGIWGTEAGRRLSVSERRLSIEESHKREIAKALAQQPPSHKAHRVPGFPTSWAARAQFNWPRLGSRKGKQEEEKTEVKETRQQSRGEEKSPPRKSPVEGEKGREEEAKMATVSEKVASDVDGGARRLLEESSSASDPNLYPSPDDINKDRYGLELERNLQLINTMLQQKYSAASLRSVTTEMLRVLNATEQLIQGAEGGTQEQAPPAQRPTSPISPTQTRKLDQQLSKLEENVYVAASSVYSLEGDLSDLEACARRIGQSTSERELAHLEDQVASAAAQVQQSELQVTDIAARIAALKTAGLNVAPKSPVKTVPKPSYRPQTITIDASRNQRRRLPAPPTKDKNTPDI